MTGAGGWLQLVSDVRREGAHPGPEKRLDQIWLLASPPLVRDVFLVPDHRPTLGVMTSTRHVLAFPSGALQVFGPCPWSYDDSRNHCAWLSSVHLPRRSKRAWRTARDSKPSRLPTLFSERCFHMVGTCSQTTEREGRIRARRIARRFTPRASPPPREIQRLLI